MGERHARGVELEAALTVNGGPLVMKRKGARILWVPPEELRSELPAEALDVTDELRKAQVQVLLRSTRNRAEFALQTRDRAGARERGLGSRGQAPCA